MRMKLLKISQIGLILILAGCAVDQIQLPNLDEAKRSDEQVSYPVEYPILCGIPDGEEFGPWDKSCWQSFGVFEELAVDAFDMAVLNAQIAETSDEAYDVILNSAKQQQRIAIIREDMLQKERKDHFFTEVKYLAVIAVGIIGIAL